MCTNQKTLHQNQVGYITICNNCDHLHIEIGSFMAVLCKHSFEMIIKDFKKIDARKQKHKFLTPSGEKILTQLTDNTYISQTPEDFDDTIELFEIASHYLNALEILKN